MHRERISWWWFLLIAGIAIPFFEILINHQIAYPGILHGYFIEGMNPVFGKIFYFLLIVFVFIVFRLIYRIKNISLSLFVYVLLAMAVLTMFFPFYIFENYEVKNENVREYVSFGTLRPSSQTILSSNNFWDITVMMVFLFFVIANYPKKRKEPSDQKALL